MDNELGTYISTKQIIKSLGISRAGLFVLMKRGEFPKGIKIGNSRRWLLDDVKAWLEAKEREAGNLDV